MKLSANLKSKTIKLAWLKKILGVVTVLLANAGYFEASVTPVVFGTILIVLGIADNYLRQVTRKPLEEK